MLLAEPFWLSYRNRFSKGIIPCYIWKPFEGNFYFSFSNTEPSPGDLNHSSCISVLGPASSCLQLEKAVRDTCTQFSLNPVRFLSAFEERIQLWMLRNDKCIQLEFIPFTKVYKYWINSLRLQGDAIKNKFLLNKNWVAQICNFNTISSSNFQATFSQSPNNLGSIGLCLFMYTILSPKCLSQLIGLQVNPVVFILFFLLILCIQNYCLQKDFLEL